MGRAFLFKLLLCIFLLPASPLWAETQFTPEFTYTNEKIPTMPEARAFRMNVDGIDIVGADIGPEDGNPLLMVGGFTSSFPYLRKVARNLNKQNFRVFIYNPPGQGRGQLQSGASARDADLGIDGMLKVFPAVRHHIFQMTGKKLVVVGHSLGGLQVRVGSVGVVFDEDGEASISEEARLQAKHETALIVPLFSMPIFGKKVWNDAGGLKVFLLRDFAPLFVDCYAALNCLVPWNISEKVTITYLGFTQNNLYSGLYGAPDLDSKELKELGNYVLPQRIERQIREDMIRWLQSRAFTTNSGFDIGKAWQEMQIGKHAIPALYVGGQRDRLLEVAPFMHEAGSLQKTKTLVVDAGHAGAFISESLPHILARTIAKARSTIVNRGCSEWLEAKNLKDVN